MIEARWMADISLPIRSLLSGIQRGGNQRYPLTSGGYEIDLMVSRPAAVFRTVVRPIADVREFSTTSMQRLLASKKTVGRD